MKKITVLSGGIGGARFVRGLIAHLAAAYPSDTGSTVEVTIIANTGDDMWLNDLRVCPDLDTLMYTLGNGVDEEQGWGRARESRRVSAEIAAYGRGWGWFTLGDLDLGTHIVRTELLREGLTLSEATRFLCDRWQPGVTLLPMSDQFVETHVRLGEDSQGRKAGELIHFEEWWVRYRSSISASEFIQVGLDTATAAPGVVDAIIYADLVVVPPSNPVVSVGTILAVPGIREAIGRTAAPVIGISPIIGGAAVRGMADRCLETIGVASSALAVGLHYGSRSNGGLLDGWLVDTTDESALEPLARGGLRAAAVPLWLSDVQLSAEIAGEVLKLAGQPVAT